MGVLERFRSGSDSTFMQVVLALIIIAFIGLYVNPQGDRSGVVASVNGEKIMDTTYGRAYRNELRRIELGSGRTLSDAEQREIGESVRQQLIENEVLMQEARRIGLEVSDSEVARQLLDIPYLRNEDGRFSQELYQRFLKRQQYTKADFEETLRDDLLRTKLQRLVLLGASMSEPALREAYVDRDTRVDLKVVRIRPADFEDEVAVTDEERAAWLKENEAFVAEAYERDFDRLYNHPEQVRLSLIRLAILEGAATMGDLTPRLNAIRAEIEGGAAFDVLARRWSEDPSAVDGGELGLRPVAQLSTEMVDAIKDVPAGGLTRVFTTEGDVRLAKVVERVPPEVDPLDEVRDAIADRLIRAEKVPAMAAAFAGPELLPKWSEGGAVPTDLLEAHGLTARDTGPIPTVGGMNPFAPPATLLDAARTAPVGAVLPEVFEETGALFVAQLTARTDPDMARYESERETIREEILAERRGRFYEDWVADLKSHAKIE